MLKKSLFQGHYRFAQAYFELGFPEKAMAVNSFAQKCCSSTLNLLCQAVAFKKGMYLVSQLFYFNGTEQWFDIYIYCLLQIMQQIFDPETPENKEITLQFTTIQMP